MKVIELWHDFKWWVIAGLSGVVVLCVAGFLLLDRPISKLVIVGDFNQVSTQCVAEVMQHHAFGRVWPTHEQQLFQQVQAHCPWLNHWQWQVRWPATVMIHLAENKATAQWNQQALINQNGQLFTTNNMQQTKVPLSLQSPPGSFAQTYQLYQQAQQMLAAQNFQITQLENNKDEGYQITLQNGMVLKLGQVQPLQKLSRFLSIDGSLFNKPHKKIAAIDLRYPHGFAVQWQKH